MTSLLSTANQTSGTLISKFPAKDDAEKMCLVSLMLTPTCDFRHKKPAELSILWRGVAGVVEIKMMQFVGNVNSNLKASTPEKGRFFC